MTEARTDEQLDPLTKWEFEWFITAHHYLWPEDFDLPQVENGNGGKLRVIWSDDDVTVILDVESQERKGFLQVYKREDPEDSSYFDPYEGMSEDEREIMAEIDNYPDEPDEPEVFDLSARPGWDDLIDRVATAIYGEDWRECLQEVRVEREEYPTLA